MHRKLVLTGLVALLLAGPAAFAQMSDDAVISYIAGAAASGKTEAQIGSDLLAKGVPASQLKRLFAEYKSGKTGGQMTTQTTVRLDSRKNTRTRNGSEVDVFSKYVSSEDDDNAAKRKSFYGMEDEPDTLETESGKPLGADKKALKKKPVEKIYGHDVFRNPRLSFEPNDNAATPDSYVLGPGDEIVIDIWGTNEATIRQEISPEGRIFVSQVGPIELGGLSIKEASGKIKSALSKKYAGIKGSNPSSQVSVTLGKIRTIKVDVLGEVRIPGTYRLSSFSTVFNALYRAGGISPVGSLREIKVMRGGEKVADVDVYSYLFEGKQSANVSLQEGDAIVVPPYSTLVSIEGGVKRPMKYEMLEGETLSALIDFAGGFSGDAHKDDFTVERKDGTIARICTVTASEASSFPMRDGDEVRVATNVVEGYANMVEVKGAVYRPGKFELGSTVATVRQLVEHAGGLLDDAFVSRAQIIREKEDRSLELVSVSLKGIMDGTADDVVLKKNDLLVVANVNEIELKGDVTISGYVENPGKYQYAEKMTVEDLILLAGGLSEGASSSRVDVSRRIVNPGSESASDTLATVFTFGISDGLVVDGKPLFELKPYDVVAVRRSPTYSEQRVVMVTGEVTFPGQYVLESNSDRISDLILRAGGPLTNGDLKGAMLKRKMNQYERNVRQSMSKVVTQGNGKDTLNIKKLTVSEIYTVGVEVDKALQKPGSDYDMVLRDGDEIIIPEKPTTVRIQGDVLYTNTVHYISGKNVRYYVEQAGGFSEKAHRSKTYVVHMNGTVSVGMRAKVDPGSEIVVPAKAEKRKATAGEVISIGSSAASFAAVIVSVLNMIN